MSISLRRHPSSTRVNPLQWLKRITPSTGKRGSSPALGIDLGTTAVKAVATRPGHGKIKVLGFSITPLPECRGENSTNQALINAITTAASEAATGCTEAAVAIRDDGILVHRFEIPAGLDDRAIAARAAHLIDTELQAPRESLRYDYRIMPAAEGLQRNRVASLVTARREPIDQLIHPLRGAGLQSTLVDVESHAIARAVNRGLGAQPGHTAALVDIGTQLRILVLTGEEISFRHSAPHPLADDPQTILNAIEQALGLYQSHHELEGIDQVWLLGGRADGALAARLATTLALPVECLADTIAVDPVGTLDGGTLKKALPRLITALGLALHHGDPDAHWR